ncbi:hypothetical protein AB5I41_01645 [Sphingomonas sp. MMS24-JH45]
MERHQWTANGRIRQDASQAVRAIGFVLLVVTLIWAKVEFEWLVIPVVGFALIIAGEASGAPRHTIRSKGAPVKIIRKAD